LRPRLFSLRDAHMPPGNVTVYETLSVLGGSMDAAGDARMLYLPRRARTRGLDGVSLVSLRQGAVLQTPGLTILDETHQANIREPIYSRYRLMEKQGCLYDYTGP